MPRRSEVFIVNCQYILNTNLVSPAGMQVNVQNASESLQKHSYDTRKTSMDTVFVKL